jgi:hypothetical protein
MGERGVSYRRRFECRKPLTNKSRDKGRLRGRRVQGSRSLCNLASATFAFAATEAMPFLLSLCSFLDAVVA